MPVLNNKMTFITVVYISQYLTIAIPFFCKVSTLFVNSRFEKQFSQTLGYQVFTSCIRSGLWSLNLSWSIHFDWVTLIANEIDIQNTCEMGYSLISSLKLLKGASRMIPATLMFSASSSTNACEAILNKSTMLEMLWNY